MGARDRLERRRTSRPSSYVGLLRFAENMVDSWGGEIEVRHE